MVFLSFLFGGWGIAQEHLSYFHFVGRIMGLAVFHGHHLDGGFTLPFYKMLLNKAIVLDDITHVDPELHRSLTWMLYVISFLFVKLFRSLTETFSFSFPFFHPQ